MDMFTAVYEDMTLKEKDIVYTINIDGDVMGLTRQQIYMQAMSEALQKKKLLKDNWLLVSVNYVGG